MINKADQQEPASLPFYVNHRDTLASHGLIISILSGCMPRGLFHRCFALTLSIEMYRNARLMFSIPLLAVSFVLCNDLYEGSNCSMEDGSQGVCKKLPECPYRVKEVQEGKRNAASGGRCGFDHFIEIVCCPQNVSEKIGVRLAEAACQEYDKNVRSNDVDDNFTYHIIGGVDAKTDEFPYMVALGIENTDPVKNPLPYTFNCGGTLISSQHVLTAAHCVSNINEKRPVVVRMGNANLNVTGGFVQTIQIADIIIHPQYKRSAHYHDAAILKLKTEVEFSDAVKPICLQTRSLDTINTTSNASIVATGWGIIDFEEQRTATRLQKTPDLRIADKTECAKNYTGFLKLPHGLDKSMFCATGQNGTITDACLGDSGGPLLLLTDSGPSLIGITAFGQLCDGLIPGVYIAIHSYLDWIEEVVFRNFSVKLDPKGSA